MATTWTKSNQAIFEQPPIRFLEAWDETFLVALPWIGAILTMGLWALARFGISWQFTDVTMLLTGLIFIDGVHIMFTYVMLASLPELKKWGKSEETRAKTGWMKGHGPWARSAIIAVVLGLIFWLLRISPNTHTLRGMATTYLFLELLGPAQHTLAQMRGISFCYNSSIRRNCKFTDAEKVQAAQCEKIERFLFTALLTGELLYWIPTIFGLDNIQIPSIDSVSFLGGVISIASVAALLVNAYYFPHQGKSRKFSFLFRVALFPLKMLTAVGGITLRAAHGTEYLIIFRRMVKGSNITQAKKTRIFLTTTAICLTYALVFCITYPVAVRMITGFKVSDMLLVWAMFGAFIVRFTHYYMDSVVYKMSDPATRAAVAPILTVDPYLGKSSPHSSEGAAPVPLTRVPGRQIAAAAASQGSFSSA